MVNTKHDVASYERCDYKHGIPLYGGEILYESFLKAKKNSSWKPEVQKFEMNLMNELAKLQDELKNRTYELSPTMKFKINERGHTRIISGDHIRDRIVKHALCDYVLNPIIYKHLIYDNGASIEGKGISFTRNRLLTHLHKYYRETGNNQGYILLIDYSKYYDNIRHDKTMELFKRYIDDDFALWLIGKILTSAQIDVSYMSDEEYKSCMNNLFNSIDYFAIDKTNFIKKKFMAKHLNIGDQLSQTVGTAYPIDIDNYIKIVKGVKYYGRYMDDSYIIAKDKQTLINLLEEIKPIAKGLGIFINIKKTHICKLDDYWRFLQVQYCLTSTGRIVTKIHPKRITHMRRMMRKLILILPKKEYANWFKSWFKSYYKLMSKQQKINLTKLFYDYLNESNVSKKAIKKWLTT